MRIISLGFSVVEDGRAGAASPLLVAVGALLVVQLEIRAADFLLHSAIHPMASFSPDTVGVIPLQVARPDCRRNRL